MMRTLACKWTTNDQKEQLKFSFSFLVRAGQYCTVLPKVHAQSAFMTVPIITLGSDCTILPILFFHTVGNANANAFSLATAKCNHPFCVGPS